MSELVVSSRDALANALLSSHVSERDGAYWVCSCGSRLVDWAEANWPLKVSLVSVHDQWMGGHQADALVASGVVRVLPDEESWVRVIRRALSRMSRSVDADAVAGHVARAVLALFAEGAKE